MKKLLCLLLVMTTVFISCKKSTTQLTGSDYLIFGHFYGECFGDDCVQFFKLESNQLSKDTKHNYPNSSNFCNASFVQLNQQKFSIAQDLFTYFPTDLLSEQQNVLGQPDAADQGGIYIEYNKNGVRKFWLLDQDKFHVANKYHNFIDKINEKIRLLQ